MSNRLARRADRLASLPPSILPPEPPERPDRPERRPRARLIWWLLSLGLIAWSLLS